MHTQPAVNVRANPAIAFLRRPVSRFVAEFVAMCAVMCIGGNVLSILFFDVLGYSNLVHDAPALSVLVTVFNLSLPMAVYMAVRGHGWGHNLTMTAGTVAVGLVVIAALSFGVIPQSSFRDWTVPFGIVCLPACVWMFILMARDFDMYSGRAGSHVHAA